MHFLAHLINFTQFLTICGKLCKMTNTVFIYLYTVFDTFALLRIFTKNSYS